MEYYYILHRREAWILPDEVDFIPSLVLIMLLTLKVLFLELPLKILY